jgi:hypothetical protein
VVDDSISLSRREGDWLGFRKTKHRLVVLLLLWVPFGVIDGGLLPLLFHSYMPSYIVALAYMIWTGITWLQYGFYPCPSCGRALRGAQIYRRTCPTCRTEINPRLTGGGPSLGNAK